MNVLVESAIISFFVTIFGKYYFIFISYLIFNILDWITGLTKAIKLKKVSSCKGVNGLLKKVSYWIVIGIAFSFSSMFVIIGNEILNINLSIMYLIGWFTFALLIINEVISILENLIALNVKVPNILIKSLEITQNILDDASKKILNINDTSDDNNSDETKIN